MTRSEQARPAALWLAGPRYWFSHVDVLGLIGIAAAIGIWWLLSLGMAPITLPGPQLVFGELIDGLLSQGAVSYLMLQGAFGGLALNLAYSVFNIAIAVTIGTLAGGAGGLASARFWVVRELLDPVSLVLGTVPILVAAPFFLIFFGPTPASQIVLVALYTAAILFVTSQRAALNLPGAYEQYASSLGATSRTRFWTIAIPAAVPAILGGFRVALAGAWGLEAIAELLGAQYGIGRVIQIMDYVHNTAGIMAAVLLLGITAVVIDVIVVRVVRWITRWQEVTPI